MDFITVIGISLGLAMDAFSVAVACGAKISPITFRHYFRLSFHFGLFQFLMPIAGYYGGVLVRDVLCQVDHWIAFALLSFIGLKMLWESFRKEGKNEASRAKDPSRGLRLVALSVATSIDAAAVGFSLAALGEPVILPAVVIGLVCVACSAFGLFLGGKIGSVIGSWAERLGGLVLIAIGVKILIEHLLS